MRSYPALVDLILVGAFALGAALAGCASGATDPPPVLAAAGVPNLAAMSMKIQVVFKALKLTGSPRVSGVRQAAVTALADWMVCLRNDANDPHIYALFIDRNLVVDYRLALVIDQCANETYGPLPFPMPVK
jgi:hypothetical protein